MFNIPSTSRHPHRSFSYLQDLGGLRGCLWRKFLVVFQQTHRGRVGDVLKPRVHCLVMRVGTPKKNARLVKDQEIWYCWWGSSEIWRAKPVEVLIVKTGFYTSQLVQDFFHEQYVSYTLVCVCVCYQVELFSFQSIFYLFLVCFQNVHQIWSKKNYPETFQNEKILWQFSSTPPTHQPRMAPSPGPCHVEIPRTPKEAHTTRISSQEVRGLKPPWLPPRPALGVNGFPLGISLSKTKPMDYGLIWLWSLHPRQ